MKEIRILGLLIIDRIKEAGQTQRLLTDNAAIIRSRLGFHEVTEATCSRTGVILLQLTGSSDQQDLLEASLRALRGVEVQRMRFEL
ncbi:MAG TPA: hypothetical protein DCR43_05665 [Bacteroidales bacterium]|nr:MAG: hypothetical protein A2X11_12195 [Bacteroidetes bacterium GWE2_42_24]OFY32448.1 MAG: hypothetical protein A2X09_07940 [Bacteroidetes bacterium GWF2_43_11]HAQ65322.1 hypothetical protein [Bacteroidales bacterium]HBZ65437.1 hypothetical protein [Bacteroidales bacterium]